MNVYDSAKIAELMKPFGFSITEEVSDANMVVLNTCHIREKASEKVYSELGKINILKEEKKQAGTNMVIVVAGCTAQAEGAEIFKRAPYVDIVVGPQSYYNLPELVAQVVRTGKFAINLDFPTIAKFDNLPESTDSRASAFLSIQEGCNEFCKFCVVPYTRGAEFSRPVADVYREALHLANRGAIEINLLGQNVNAYHGLDHDNTESSLAKLIRYLSKIDQIKRLRYTTSHPHNMTDELIELFGSEPKLMPYLHLPVQSGSSKILKAMNRKHKREDYLRIIEKIKSANSDMALSSDFIVGYPGETEEDFSETMSIVREVGYAQAYSFKYSKRPGTPASIMDNQVDEEVKAERLARLQALIFSNQEEFNKKFVGRKIEVLFDRTGKHKGQILGRTPHMQSIYIDNATEYFGQLMEVEVVSSTFNNLHGRLIRDSKRDVA